MVVCRRLVLLSVFVLTCSQALAQPEPAIPAPEPAVLGPAVPEPAVPEPAVPEPAVPEPALPEPALPAASASTPSAAAIPPARESRVHATWEATGVTTLDRAVPLAFSPAPLPVAWLAPRLNLGHFPFSWVEVGAGLTLRLADYVRVEGSFDYAVHTFPERAWDKRLHLEGALGVKVWSRDSKTRWRYALGAARPQSQYASTKVQYVELELPNREAFYLEGGFISSTLGYRRCEGDPCEIDQDAKLSGAWVHHVRAGGRFTRLTWAHLDNSDSVRSMIEVAAYALLNVGTLPNRAVFEAPAFRTRDTTGAAPLGAEALVRYTPWYYQWVTVELMLGYLPGPRSAEFRLGFSLPLWLAPWDVNQQFKARTGGKSVRD